MNSDLRFVFDTNVIVSATLFNASVPGKAFLSALDRGTILLSQAVIHELADVLSREKFNRYVTVEEREAFLEALIREAELVEIVDEIKVCRDPKDDRILELAVNGRASFVVTGDDDLLVLNPFQDISIVTASALLDLLGRVPLDGDA